MLLRSRIPLAGDDRVQYHVATRIHSTFPYRYCPCRAQANALRTVQTLYQIILAERLASQVQISALRMQRDDWGGGQRGGGRFQGGGGADTRPGDWTCPGCNANVFASKYECFKCRCSPPEQWNAALGRISRRKSLG